VNSLSERLERCIFDIGRAHESRKSTRLRNVGLSAQASAVRRSSGRLTPAVRSLGCMKTQHVLIGCLLAALVVVGSCVYFVFFQSTITHWGPTVVAKRDAKGRVMQEFIYEGGYEQRGLFPGAHGPVSPVVRKWTHCFIRDPGKPNRELTFLNDVGQINPASCRPVADTPLWSAYLDPTPGDEGALVWVVFDETHLVSRRAIHLENTPDSSPASELTQDGRVLIYYSAKGWEAYDLVTGKVTPATRP